MRLIRRELASSMTQALVLGGVLGLALPALADDAPATGQATPQQPETKKEATNLSQVTVTAQSRKQELEAVPIAIDVVNGAEIATHAATDISKIDMFIPGLSVDASQPTQPSYEIRGIGGSGFGVGTDPAVGVYMDGVYAARSGASVLAFNDVQRIEVLKGPQGTLFGRNAAAGAISIISNRPDPSRFGASGLVRIGNYGEVYAAGMLNLPVSPNAAFRFSLVDNQSDGWLTDRATHRDYASNNDWGLRSSWLWNIGGDTTLWLTWNHERLNQPPRAAIGLVALSSDVNQPAPFPADPATYLNPLHAPLYNDAVGGGEWRHYDDVTLHLDHYFKWGQLSSISAWRGFRTYNSNDNDGTNHDAVHFDELNAEANRSFYQEFKLSGDNDVASWLAGASWYKEIANQTSGVGLYTDSVDTMIQNLGVPTGTPDGTIYHYFTGMLQAAGLPFSLLHDYWQEQIRNRGDYQSYAVYGDVIWHLTDTVNLTTGARLTRDEKEFSWFNLPRIAPALDQTIATLDALGVLAQAGVPAAVFQQNLVFTDAVGELVHAKNSWNDFSPRVVLDDHFTPNIMGYVSVAKGYKAGGYNSVQVASHFAPEKVWNYEAGIKAVFPAANLVVNGSVYHYRYSNLQDLTLIPNATGSGVPGYVVSSSDEKADGADLALQWQPLADLSFHANAAYINSRYGHKIGALGEDLSGDPTGVPKVSYTVGVQYGWNAGGGRMTANLSHAFRGAARCNADMQFNGACAVSPNFTVGGPQNRTDARLDWTAPGGHWGVALYANNLFDQRYVMQVNNVSASVLGTPNAFINAPRLYGVEFHAKL
ncbi:MAG TPA: TonB-dependent receptor [Rhodanobacter sp.]|nr:TonB-dependent receptor [Rhodanobacter sp.]